MRYWNTLYLIFGLISLCISISIDSESSKTNSFSMSTKYINFTGQYMVFCKTNIYAGEKYKFFELVLYAKIDGFIQEETFILNLQSNPYAYMTCTIPVSTMMDTNVTCIIDTKQFYSDTIYLPEEFPKISDCQVSYWKKVPKQIFVNCSVNEKRSILLEPNLSYKSTYKDFQVKTDNNFSFSNYENQEKSVNFQRRNYDCYLTYFQVNFVAYIAGYDSYVKYRMYLNSPQYSYMECTIPSSYYSSQKTIECILNTEKFPIIFHNGIYFRDHYISARVSNWESVNKNIDYNCYPNFKTMYPRIITGVGCAMEDYNTFITYSSVNKPYESNNTFNLSVSINGEIKEIPCEFYYRQRDSSSRFYCYSKGPGTINFFPTTIKTNYATRYLIEYQNIKEIVLKNCSITKKSIYFNFGLQNCSKNYPYEVHFNIILYAKISHFSSDYSFKIDLVNSTYEYLECSIPNVSGFQALSYIECFLDRLKFPLLDVEKIILPTQLSLEDIDILHWDFVDNEYKISSCLPEYSFIFSPEKYMDSHCYKAFNSLFSTIGQISLGNSNNTNNASDYYNFDINAIVDGKFTKLPCELINLNISNSPNNYKLNCIAYGNRTAEIFNTIVIDKESEHKDLIYINISHNYTLQECIPSKIIDFKSTKEECIHERNIFNIYFYADIKGYSSEEKIKIYLKKPSYIYMECTIPKTVEDSSEQYIQCIIDTEKFPLINYDIITLPDEFIENPGLDIGILNWENINKEIATEKCSSNYDISFNLINILDIECYSNGFNTFIADGNKCIKSI